MKGTFRNQQAVHRLEEITTEKSENAFSKRFKNEAWLFVNGAVVDSRYLFVAVPRLTPAAGLICSYSTTSRKGRG